MDVLSSKKLLIWQKLCKAQTPLFKFTPAFILQVRNT